MRTNFRFLVLQNFSYFTPCCIFSIKSRQSTGFFMQKTTQKSGCKVCFTHRLICLVNRQKKTQLLFESVCITFHFANKFRFNIHFFRSFLVEYCKKFIRFQILIYETCTENIAISARLFRSVYLATNINVIYWRCLQVLF